MRIPKSPRTGRFWKCLELRTSEVVGHEINSSEAEFTTTLEISRVLSDPDRKSISVSFRESLIVSD